MSEHRPGSEELLRFIVGEGLEPGRRREIAARLLTDPALREEHDRVMAALDAAVRARTHDAPDAGFEQRLWSRIRRDLSTGPVAASPRPRMAPALAWAAVLLVGIAIAWWLRPGAPEVPLPGDDRPNWLADDAASRILERELATYFDAAARVLDPRPAEDAARMLNAGALAHRNRLYAAAAERSGRMADVALLRQLSEPLDALAAGAVPLESPKDLERLAFQSRGFAHRSRAASPNANANRRS